MERYFKRVAGVGSGNYIYFWKSRSLPDERINSITASNYSITPKLHYYDNKIRVQFSGSCLKQDKITYNHGKLVSICIVYEISRSFNASSYPTLENRFLVQLVWLKMLILLSINIWIWNWIW